MAGKREEKVAERAYQLYEGRGRREGAALDDWLTAEREIEEQERGTRQPKRPAKKAATTVKKAAKKTTKKVTRKKNG
jgi:hypothetical protein